ncbi:MAG: type II toxin-antitoxin system VapC family toxin [Actinobacteria bacterium]|nr:type II toxin-antitoxin system VapC family toxin [Actinomycetota bacterium]
MEIAEAGLVVDASVFVEYLAPGPAHGDVAPLFDPESRVELWTPDLCLLEVANALRKRFLTDKRFTRRHLVDGVADLLALGPLVVSSRVLVDRTIQFVENLTVYDAVYLVLAAARRIPLCTLDTGLAAEARRARVTVLVPGIDALVT